MRYFRRLRQRLRHALTGRFLCDSCKYDYGSACARPERPNAVVCDGYARKRS